MLLKVNATWLANRLGRLMNEDGTVDGSKLNKQDVRFWVRKGAVSEIEPNAQDEDTQQDTSIEPKKDECSGQEAVVVIEQQEKKKVQRSGRRA